MNIHERIIEAINKLRPFKTGDDPVLCRQNDTIDRVEEIVTRVIRDHFLTDNATKSSGEVDKTSTTYAEYLWRERTEPVFNVVEQPSIQPEVIKGSSSGTISFDTEQTEKRKLSELKPKVDCDHLWLTKAGTAYRFKFVELCAKCGVKL